MFVVSVTFHIDPDQLAAFLPFMLANARASVADEPGCRQFDVCQNTDHPTEISLYELYDDAAAFEAHKKTPHFRSFVSVTDGMIVQRSVKTLLRLEQP